jgi:preprotein translocase subunit SecD
MSGDNNKGLMKYLTAALAIAALLVCILAVAALLKPQTADNSSPDDRIQVTSPPTLLLKLTPLAGDGNVSDSQLSLTKSILKLRLSEYGPDTSVIDLRDEQGTAMIIAHYGNISYDDAVSLATTPGKFEMRIRTEGNESGHILYGDDIRNASAPMWQTMSNGSTVWSVIFKLTDEGAEMFRQACIDSGATKDPNNHSVIMLLDDRMFYSGTLSPEVAGNIDAKPLDSLMAMTGIGDSGHSTARKVSVCLQAGSLPVKVEILNPATR